MTSQRTHDFKWIASNAEEFEGGKTDSANVIFDYSSKNLTRLEGLLNRRITTMRPVTRQAGSQLRVYRGGSSRTSRNINNPYDRSSSQRGQHRPAVQLRSQQYSRPAKDGEAGQIPFARQH
uniref:Uncharacterized protein n=1 Tax=Steinernema glaseri TaxID=37863 RepID=A0A1I7YBT7_9BILA